MCKTTENIKKELLEKLDKTTNPIAKKAIEEKLKKLGDSETVVK